MSAKTKVMKTKIRLKHGTYNDYYNLSDLKHDPHCGCVELGDSAWVS